MKKRSKIIKLLFSTTENEIFNYCVVCLQLNTRVYQCFQHFIIPTQCVSKGTYAPERRYICMQMQLQAERF